jgi:hypothetical protein
MMRKLGAVLVFCVTAFGVGVGMPVKAANCTGHMRIALRLQKDACSPEWTMSERPADVPSRRPYSIR